MNRTNFPDTIFWISLCWMSGLVCNHFFTLPIVSLGIVFILILIIALQFSPLRPYSLLLLVILSANMRAQLYHTLPDQHLQFILDHKTSITQPIQGKIISEVVKKEKSYHCKLALDKINGLDTIGNVNFYTQQENLHYGDIIQTVAEIKEYDKPSNPYSFDYNEFMSFKKLYGVGFAKTVITVNGNQKNIIQSVVISIRKWLRNRIETRFSQNSGFFRAILIGEKENIDDLSLVLNRAGLSHILAVSGLHVAILSFALFLIIQLIVRKRNLARLILIILLLVYAAICHWSASVTRAMIMISIYLIGKMLQKKADSNNYLAASFLLITIINPDQLFSIGFQLSFLAVFSLLNIVPRVSFFNLHKKDSAKIILLKKALNSILLIMFSSFILGFSLAPVTMLYFHQLNLNGIVANVIAIPLMGFLLPLSLVIIAFPAWLSVYFESITEFLFFIFKKWAYWCADFPLHFTYLRFTVYQFTIALVLLLLLAFLMLSKKWKLILTFCFVLTLSVSMIKQNTKNLIVTFFDCGLGDLLLIENPNQEVILIDTGPPDFAKGHFSHSASGYFQTKGIDTIDWVVITHAHNDHYGGLEYVLKNFAVKHLLITDEFKKRSIWHFFEPLIPQHTKVVAITDTMFLPVKNGKVQILHPDQNYSHQNINNMSIVTLLDYEELEILFTGDLEEEGEEYLLHHYSDRLDSDVLKVGHHGSKTSSTERFINEVSPQFAFISTSLKNRFHFPHEITVQKYDFLEDRLLIAGRDGALQIQSDGKTAIIETVKSKKYYFCDHLND